MDFATPPSYSRYRALRLTDPHTIGFDVFALQTMLDYLGNVPLTLDGNLGPATADAVLYVQTDLGLTQDRIVGPATWRAGVDVTARHYRDQFKVASGLLYGQLSHESGFLGGNYSPLRDDGSYDAGVAQLNTRIYKPEQGFNVPASVELLAKNTSAYYSLFEGVPERRRWTLAAGAHNAPAFSCWYARNEGASHVKKGQTAKPGAKATKLFDAYLASVTAYLKT